MAVPAKRSAAPLRLALSRHASKTSTNSWRAVSSITNRNSDRPFSSSEAKLTSVYQLSEEIPLPYVLKGIFYGASVVQSIEEAVAAFYRTTAQWGLPVIIQEFLEGEEYDIVAVGDGSGHIVGALPMKKTFLTDKGKGWAGVTVKDPRLLEITEKFCRTTKWRGPCEVEVI